MREGNIVLTGFMGTGKSVVGRCLADRLGWASVDIDAEIVTRAGRTIPEIFATQGEEGFRAIERHVCLDVAQRSGVVIATGGGALLDPVVREAMEVSGTVICLTCEMSELMCRLEGETARPLLDGAGPDRRQRIERLLGERSKVYADLPHHIDTTGRSPEEVAAVVLDLLDEVVLPVWHRTGAYDIRIGLGGLERLGESMRLAGIERSAAVALVTNPVVDAHHGATARDSLAEAGYRASTHLVPDGEAHKRLATVERLADSLVDGRLDRKGVIVGLGGGVTTDMAGFAAATFLRGVRVVQVPTTLLAMVDASVGGKTGVDLERGKNLVGAFWQPELVVIDPQVLRTLPEAELRCGLAETIKQALLGDAGLFSELSNGSIDLGTWWGGDAVERLTRALRVKIDVVEEDPLENGRRATLNLGHTVGHAIEATSGFTIRHGEAVAIGMLAAAKLSAALGETDESLVRSVEDVLLRWGLPTRCPNVEADRLVDAMQHDKKRTADGLRWILPLAVGKAEIAEGVPEEAVRGVLLDMGARREA